MKILHTADWHIGKRLGNFSRIEEQRDVLDEICQIADEQEVDAVIIAGDLYDHFNPSNEAEELFYKTLKRLSKDGNRAVIAIAGNHDSPERIEAPNPLARACGILLVGFPDSKVEDMSLDSGLKVLQSEEGFVELSLPNQKTPLRLLLTPYANEFRLKKYLTNKGKEEAKALRELLAAKWAELAKKHCDKKGINLLVAHLFFMVKGTEAQKEPEGEKVINIGGATAIYTENIPKQVQYVALGHLHRYQRLGEKPCPVIYSSSPLAYSFAEANQKKYVVIVEAEKGKEVVYNPIVLEKGKPLLRQTCSSVEEAIEWLKENQHALVELTMFTDTYLDGKERKALHEVHKGIVAIMPKLREESMTEEEAAYQIDLSKSLESLFVEYFQNKHGQEPGKDILDLFREVQGL